MGRQRLVDGHEDMIEDAALTMVRARAVAA
ncbi:hypothetical protein [Burkholderia ambifaria]|nr:hypothetical protein [Burkholderia ambifaria]